MLTVTDAAAGYLSDLLDRAEVSEDTAVRLVVEGDELSPVLDTARPGDTTFNRCGRKVLLLDTLVSEALSERTLKIVFAADGPSLRIS